jgi:hypothetical protein
MGIDVEFNEVATDRNRDAEPLQKTYDAAIKSNNHPSYGTSVDVAYNPRTDMPEYYLTSRDATGNGMVWDTNFKSGSGGMQVRIHGKTVAKLMNAMLECPRSREYLAEAVDYIREKGKTGDGKSLTVTERVSMEHRSVEQWYTKP